MAQATNTTEGQIVLSGDLYGDDATFPTLVPSGVTEGTYTGFKNTGTAIPSAPFYSYVLHVDAKGRITYAKEYGVSVAVNDATAISKGIARIGTGINGSSGTWSIADGTTSTKGKLMAGSGLSTTNGTMYCTYNGAPLASASVFGAAQPGSYMNMTSGALTVDFSNLIATDSVTGTVKVGSNLNVTGDGTLSHASWADGTTSSKGLLQVGSTLSVSSGVVSIPDGTAAAKGKLQVGDGLNVSAGVVSLNRTSYATDTVAGVVKSGWSTGVSGSGVMTLSPGWAAVGYKGIVSVGAGLSVTGGAISLSEPTRLPASSSQLGLVKVPTANGLSVAGDGTLSYVLSTATNSIKGVFTVNSNLQNTDGVVSVKIADASTLGGVKIGENLTFSSDAISLPAAGASLGLVKVGSGMSIDGAGALSLAAPADATTSQKGIVQIDNSNGLSISAGVLSCSLSNGDNTTMGVIKGDGTTVNISSGNMTVGSIVQVTNTSGFALRTAGLVIQKESVTHSSGGVYTPSANTLVHEVTLTSNISTITWESVNSLFQNGTEFFVIFRQDATGGRTMPTILGNSISSAPNSINIAKYVRANGAVVPVYFDTGL